MRTRGSPTPYASYELTEITSVEHALRYLRRFDLQRLPCTGVTRPLCGSDLHRHLQPAGLLQESPLLCSGEVLSRADLVGYELSVLIAEQG